LKATKESKRREACAGPCGCVSGLLHKLQTIWEDSPEDDSMEAMKRKEKLYFTDAKSAGVRLESDAFYAKGQASKNILSFGDQEYERDAVMTLKASRTKAILMPESPSLEQLVGALVLAEQMLPSYVRYDGPLDVSVYDEPWFHC